MANDERMSINDKLYIRPSDTGNTNSYRLILKLSTDIESPTFGINLSKDDIFRLHQKLTDIKKDINKSKSKVDYYAG